MARLRILIADDHVPTREEVRRTLVANDRFEVSAVVGNAAAAVKEAIRTKPHLCLLDIRMPGSGIAATWEITARLPEAKVVMFTVSDESNDLFAALRAGASGYLLKDTDPLELGDLLLGVAAGQAAIPPILVARMVQHFRDRAPRHRRVTDAPLTSREWEVLDLMAQGQSNAQIARTLSITPITVRNHVGSVLRKLRVPDRESAVRLFSGP